MLLAMEVLLWRWGYKMVLLSVHISATGAGGAAGVGTDVVL